MNDRTKILSIWGTGNVCSQLMASKKDIQPAFFIDNDKNRTGTIFYGVSIRHPDEIKNWGMLYIILALDNYFPVKKFLESFGLKQYVDFIWYRDLIAPKNWGIILEHVESFQEKCRRDAGDYMGKRLLFSDFLSYDKGACEFVNGWNEENGELVLFSEAGWLNKKTAEEKMNIPVIQLPEIFWRNLYLKNGYQVPLPQNKIDMVKRIDYLEEAALNLRMGYPDMAINYEYAVCYYTEQMMRKLIKYWKPKEIILWNAFYAFHFVIRNICREETVPVRYMEFGNIPGTIIVEHTGQMGESWPARETDKFMKIPVKEKDYERTEQLIKNLKVNGLNRNVQPCNNLLEKVKEKLNNNCPVILYAGQNDNASGMQPYSENTRRYHSPIFHTSDEAAVYLGELCRRQGWNFIYKPHPMVFPYSRAELLNEKAIIVNNVDINRLIDLADVVITILSTVSYIALIREKPVVMLGYTQLKEKGCTYEAFHKNEIYEQISRAIANPERENKRMKFIEHVVQLNNYYSLVRKNT